MLEIYVNLCKLIDFCLFCYYKLNNKFFTIIFNNKIFYFILNERIINLNK